MRDERLDHLAGVRGRVGDHVDDTVRDAGIAQRRADQPVRRRAKLGCLEDDGVAAGERHRDRAHAKQHRCIPWRDAEHDTGRLAQGHREEAPVGGDHLAGHRTLAGRLAQQGARGR